MSTLRSLLTSPTNVALVTTGLAVLGFVLGLFYCGPLALVSFVVVVFGLLVSVLFGETEDYNGRR